MIQDNAAFYVSLQERLELTKKERTNIKDQLDSLDGKIKMMISHIQVRPRLSDEQLVDALRDLEYQHSTTPQSNVDEREFMRQISRLKKQRKELAEYNIAQNIIDELKRRRTTLTRDLKERDIYLNELFQGVRKLRVANRFNFDPSILIEHPVSIPEDKLAHIIGRGGSAVKNIETDCRVGIDVERMSGRMRIVGLPDGVAVAMEKIQLILDTVTEEFTLTDPYLIVLLKEKAALVQTIQEHCDVRIDVSRANKVCKVIGLRNDVASAVSEIRQLDCVLEVIPLDPTVLPFLIGKGGVIVRSIQNAHKIHLDFSRETKIITIVGLRNDVSAARGALTDLINENKEIEDKIICSRYVIMEAVFGPKGSIIRQLQKEMNVGLTLDREKVDEAATTGKPSATTKSKQSKESEMETLYIRGTTAKVLAAKQQILEMMAAYNAQTDLLRVPEYGIPLILGKKGAKVMSIRERHPDVTIDILADECAVRLNCPDEQKRLEARATIQALIDDNYRAKYPLPRLAGISLKTQKGSETRSKLQNVFHINFDIDPDTETISFRGRAENFPGALELLERFCDENYTLENIYSEEDFSSFLNGGEDSLAKRVELDFEVALFIMRKQNMVRINGNRQAVDAADGVISRILHGDPTCGESILVPIQATYILPFIGKGGDHIKAFQKSHSVTIDILRSRNLVRIRGSPPDVRSAHLDLLAFFDGLRSSAVLDLNTALVDGEGDGSSIEFEIPARAALTEIARSAGDIFGVDITIPVEENRLIFQGSKRLVEASKQYILDEIRGYRETSIPLLEIHLRHFQTNPTSLAKLQNSAQSTGVQASLTSFSATDGDKKLPASITLLGPVRAMTKAVLGVYRLLDYLFPAEFATVPTDYRSLQYLWRSSLIEWDINRSYPSAVVTYDALMSCARIVAPDPNSLNDVVQHLTSLIVDRRKVIAVVSVPEDLLSRLSSRRGEFAKIEKASKSTVQIPRDGRTEIVIVGTNEESTESAKTRVVGLLETMSKEYWQISLPADMVVGLIGKGGSNVNKLRTETGANIELDMKSKLVTVTGKEANVTRAKNLILEYKTKREEEGYVERIPITSGCIPVIIGQKGATIRELRSNSGVLSIDIDRERSFVSLKGRVECCLKAKTDIMKLIDDAGIDLSLLAKPAAREKDRPEAATPPPQMAAAPKIPVGVPPEVLARISSAAPAHMSKSSIRRMRRRMREQGYSENGHADGGEEQGDSDSEDGGSDSGIMNGDAQQFKEVKSDRIDSPSLPLSSTQAPVPRAAGSLLSMLLTSPSVTSLPPPVAPIPKGPEHVPAISSAVNSSEPTGYFKSKSGFSVRL